MALAIKIFMRDEIFEFTQTANVSYICRSNNRLDVNLTLQKQLSRRGLGYTYTNVRLYTSQSDTKSLESLTKKRKGGGQANNTSILPWEAQRRTHVACYRICLCIRTGGVLLAHWATMIYPFEFCFMIRSARRRIRQSI